MKPTLGRIVHYQLTARDVERINRRRITAADIQKRIAEQDWPMGAQAHVGLPVIEGELYPFVVTRVLVGERVNGQVLLDGNDTLHATQVQEGTTPGTWRWPAREN